MILATMEIVRVTNCVIGPALNLLKGLKKERCYLRKAEYCQSIVLQ